MNKTRVSVRETRNLFIFFAHQFVLCEHSLNMEFSKSLKKMSEEELSIYLDMKKLEKKTAKEQKHKKRFLDVITYLMHADWMLKFNLSTLN